MGRQLLQLILYIFIAIVWGFGIYVFGEMGVMQQPFLADKDAARFYLFMPAAGVKTQKMTINFSVPTRWRKRDAPTDDDNCRVTITWPYEKDITFDGKNGGMPTVGDKMYGMYFAQGLDLQLRIVRDAAVTQWQRQALEENHPSLSTTLRHHSKSFCLGSWKQEKLDSDKWTDQLAIVGDKASDDFSRQVRDEFDRIQRQARDTWLMWGLAVPLIFIMSYIVSILVRGPW